MPVSSPTETDFSMAYTKQRSLEEKEENDRVLIGEDMLRSSSLPHLNQSQDTTTDVFRSTNGNRCFCHPGRFVISKKEMMSHLSTWMSSTCLSIEMNDSFWSDCIVEFDLKLERWSLRLRLITSDQMEKLNKERLHLRLFFLRSSSSILN